MLQGQRCQLCAFVPLSRGVGAVNSCRGGFYNVEAPGCAGVQKPAFLALPSWWAS